jgi:nucleoid-associated protein EbfC
MSKGINKIIKQAQKMQSQMAKAQQDLAAKQVEGVAGGGMVKVVLSGAGDIQAVSIDKTVVDPADVEMLEDLVMAAFTGAQARLKELTSSTFGAVTGGMQIPGLM